VGIAGKLKRAHHLIKKTLKTYKLHVVSKALFLSKYLPIKIASFLPSGRKQTILVKEFIPVTAILKILRSYVLKTKKP